MVAYLGYTLRMRTLFRGWPIMVNDTHTRRRRSYCWILRGNPTQGIQRYHFQPLAWLLTWDMVPYFWNSFAFPRITTTLACGSGMTIECSQQSPTAPSCQQFVYSTKWGLFCRITTTSCYEQGDYLSGKSGNVREFDGCQGSVREKWPKTVYC